MHHGLDCLDRLMASPRLVPALCACLLAAVTLLSLRHIGVGTEHPSSMSNTTVAAQRQPASLPSAEKRGAGFLFT